MMSAISLADCIAARPFEAALPPILETPARNRKPTAAPSATAERNPHPSPDDLNVLDLRSSQARVSQSPKAVSAQKCWCRVHEAHIRQVICLSLICSVSRPEGKRSLMLCCPSSQLPQGTQEFQVSSLQLSAQ